MNSSNSFYIPNQRSFRLIAFQPLSLTLTDPKPFNLKISNIPCQFMIRPVYSDMPDQRTHGGTLITVDFSLANKTDVIAGTRIGLDLIEDFLSGVSLVEGTTFSDVKPIQAICFDSDVSGKYVLVHFLNLPLLHWNNSISDATLNSVRSFLAHWDGLDSGKRLRRAAHQYHIALGTDNVIDAYQHAYMGLEALEKPLADVIKIPAGVEEVKGHCESCKAEYTRRRTLLAGVRAFICGNMHPEMASPERKKDWKELNKLRQEVFHNLEDSANLEQNAQSILPAAMHYLHDAICCLSHAHTLETSNFKLARGPRQIVFIGQYTSPQLGPLEEWQPMFDVEDGYWINDSEHGCLPEFKAVNHGIAGLEGIFFWLELPLRNVQVKDLEPVLNWKNKKVTDLDLEH